MGQHLDHCLDHCLGHAVRNGAVRGLLRGTGNAGRGAVLEPCELQPDLWLTCALTFVNTSTEDGCG